MNTNLKLGKIPGGVGMSRTFYIAVLDFKGRLAGMDIHREQSLHKNLMLFPVDLIPDINAGRIPVNADILADD